MNMNMLGNLKAGLLVLSLSIILIGCAGQQARLPAPPPQPAPDTQPEPEPSGQSTPLPSSKPEIIRPKPERKQKPSKEQPPSDPKQVSSAAVMSLLKTADRQASADRMSNAAATLQRALSIEPRNPFIYQRLAAVRLAQEQPDQTEALAEKSNSLAGNNPFIRGDNWRLIAEARRRAGDSSGQQAAMDKVEQYRLQRASYQ